jgi:hypothetical protein
MVWVLEYVISFFKMLQVYLAVVVVPVTSENILRCYSDVTMVL